MTEPDFAAKYERVLTALGLCQLHCKGGQYKPDLSDHDPRRDLEWIPCPHGQPEPHDIPAPELTDAIAWQVLMAAAKKNVENDWQDGRDDPLDYALVTWLEQAHDDPKRALILALADALQGPAERGATR